MTTGQPIFESTPTAPAPRAPLWQWHLALAAPFLLCQLILLATGRTLPVFWGEDEPDVHWKLTLWFAERLPHFDPLYDYSATTPLFHLLGAVMVRLCGPHLLLLRALNAGFSLAGVWALFASLRRSSRHGPGAAALLSAVFLTSCYFFGYSFRWLTDNLALTFCLLALGRLFRFADAKERDRLGAFLIGCGWAGLAVLTRQSFLFLCLPFAVMLVTSGLRPGAVMLGLGGLALALAPFAVLAGSWRGLVPPALRTHYAFSPVNLYPVALPVMLLGFYAPFFVAPAWRSRAEASSKRHVGRMAAAAVIGLLAVWLFPLVPTPGRPDLGAYFPEPAREDVPGYFAGWIYTAAAHLPKLHGNSLLFWALLPAGLAAAMHFALEAARPGADPRGRAACLFLFAVLLGSSLNGKCAQKYYDAPILLFLIWDARGEITGDRRRRAALGGLILLFVAYFCFVAVRPPDRPASPALPGASTDAPPP